MGNYATGKRSKAIDPISGWKIDYKDLKQRWDGLWVHKSRASFDPKHPQLDPVKNVHDPQALEHPWPDNDDDSGQDTTNPWRQSSFVLSEITNPTFGDGVE